MNTIPREPATKFYGPNRRYQPVAGSNVRVLVQVYNLQPGEFWEPSLEAELLTPQVLVPLPPRDVYAIASANFGWALHWRFQRTEFIVRRDPFLPFAFRFNPIFGVQKWCVNELTIASGNYAFAGTATISWFKV